MDEQPTLHIFTTGGTIDKVYFDQKSEFQIGDPQAGGVLERANVNLTYKLSSIFRKDSLDLTDSDRDQIRDAVAASTARRILVTHGTDTMVETARKLKQIPKKTIVLTGSMYPAKFHESDAIFNIGSAVAAVQTLPEGVYIVINGRIFDPDNVKKNVALNRFELLK